MGKEVGPKSMVSLEEEMLQKPLLKNQAADRKLFNEMVPNTMPI